jgi:hypothetical protein
MEQTKCYVVAMKETGVLIKVFIDKLDADNFVQEHNDKCFSYEQLYTVVECDMEVHTVHEY